MAARPPQRVHVAPARIEQQIRELDEHTSAYQRLYTPISNNSSNTLGGRSTITIPRPSSSSSTTSTATTTTIAILQQPTVAAADPHQLNVAILDDSNDDDDDDDDESCDDRTRRSVLQRKSLGRARVESSSSTMMLHSTSHAVGASSPRLHPRLRLHAITNRFHDERLEESYQLYSSTCDFGVARRIVLFLLAFDLSAYLLFLYLKHACAESQASARAASTMAVTFAASMNDTSPLEPTQPSSCFSYEVGANGLARAYTVLLWAFAPVAGLYSLLPLQYFAQHVGLRYGVYFIRRRWKALGAAIILLWSVSMAIVLSKTLAQMRVAYQTQVLKYTTCGRAITVPEQWYRASNWHIVNAKLYQDHGMYVREWIYIYDSKVAYSVIVAVLAALAALVGIVSVAMKLDFVHVLGVTCAQAITTLVLVVTGPSMSLNSDITHKVSNQTFLFGLCIVVPACVTLLATYSEDRAARSAYVSKLHAERINTTLKLDLSVKRNGLENPHDAGAEEQAAMAAALNDANAMVTCQSVAIPFADLDLKVVLSKGPTGDVLRADYYGTSVVFKRLAVSALTPDGLADFCARVELLASLRHPNVVQFIGASFDDVANVGIVLEYLERGDVLALLRSSMALTWSDPLLKIATAVAQGMTYLHNCDPPLVHRDLKSTNLLCTPTYSCKISDFGESKRATGLFQSVVGTPYWVAPEIIREERYDMQVDCYSFGIVLIELETRKLPYHDLREYAAADIMQLVAFGHLRPTIPASCSPFRRQLITRCLDADPRRRPRMAEILSVLQHEVRQELLEQNSIDSSRDKRRLMLLQRHQRLNRRGLKALLQDDDDDGNDGVGK